MSTSAVDIVFEKESKMEIGSDFRKDLEFIAIAQFDRFTDWRLNMTKLVSHGNEGFLNEIILHFFSKT